jgi:hypothetical protein
VPVQAHFPHYIRPCLVAVRRVPSSEASTSFPACRAPGPGLARIIEAWANLPKRIRAAVLMVVESET